MSASLTLYRFASSWLLGRHKLRVAQEVASCLCMKRIWSLIALISVMVKHKAVCLVLLNMCVTPGLWLNIIARAKR